MKRFATLREIVDSKMEFDAVYLKVAHPDAAGEMWGYSPAITSVDEMLPRLMDLSLKSYSFTHADYYLNVGFDYITVLYMHFVPTEDHSTNIDGDFIDIVSRLRFQDPLDTSNGDVV
jgi:hypothetical protein